MFLALFPGRHGVAPEKEMEQERRQFKRLPTALIARLRTRKATATETLQLQIGNVSTGGVFITTPYPFPVGTIVEFDFTLPHSESLIHVKGVVRWTRMRGNETGMGVEFIEASTDSRAALKEYVQRRLTAGDLPLPPSYYNPPAPGSAAEDTEGAETPP